MLRRLIFAATLLSVGGWALVATTNDANALGMLLGFAPRWWAVLPWALLLPLSFFAGRRASVAAAVGAAVSLFGIAQFELPALSTWRQNERARPDIRVVSYNTDLSTTLAYRIRADLRAWDADIVLLQDCKTELFDSLRVVVPHAYVHDRFCYASRWPLVNVADATKLKGANGTLRLYRDAVRFRVRTPFGVLPVYSVHFPSPRYALGAARWFTPRALLPRLRESLAERGSVSAGVSRVVNRAQSHFLVAGDFNLPFGSAILQRDWGDLTNAFAHAGFGFGHTMQAGIFPVRIDQVLVPSGLVPTQARVLKGYPSEHQPVIVDLLWRG